MIERARCPICGDPSTASTRSVGEPSADWRQKTCESCGFVYLDPCYSPVELAVATADDTAAADIPEEAYTADVRRHTDILQRLESIVPGRHLLEVGCGVGQFLVAARQRRWHAYGTETSAPVRERAWRKLGGVVSPDAFTPHSFPTMAFDVIVLRDVLGGAPDPPALMAEAFGKLSADGVMLVAVSDEAEPDAVEGAPGAPPPANAFTSASLQHLLTQAGLRVEYLERHADDGRLWSIARPMTAAPGETAAAVASETDLSASVNATDLAFIIGNQRSGTTILRRLLEGHPQIHCIEEYDSYRCTADPATLRRVRASLPPDSRIVLKAPMLTEAFLPGGIVPCGIAPIRGMERYQTSKLVHMTRHVVDVVASLTVLQSRINSEPLSTGVRRWLFSQPLPASVIGMDAETVEHHPHRDLVSLALLWNVRGWARLEYERLGADMLAVKYEDLVRQPAEGLDRIREFLDVAELPLNDYPGERKIHTTSIRKGTSAFTTAEIDAILSASAPMLEQLQY